MSIVNITEHDLRRVRRLDNRVCLEAIEPHLKSVLDVVLGRAGYATEAGLYRWDENERCWRSFESYQADQARLADLAAWYADVIAKGGPLGSAAWSQAMSCSEPLKRRINDILAQRAQARLADLAAWYADVIAKGGPLGSAAWSQAMSCSEPLKRRIGELLARQAGTS